jgi:uncharacterized small protein (DUF1192 family)
MAMAVMVWGRLMATLRTRTVSQRTVVSVTLNLRAEHREIAMVEDMVPPRMVRGASLTEVTREDLELYAADDLEERIARLEGEIRRTRSALERKQAGRAAADALFSVKA